jgi:hypothetical protein
MITQERLKELFDYQDGNLVWKVKKAQAVKIGTIAGWANRDVHGQQYMNIEIDGTAYKLHRLVFMYHHGYFPSRVDHIDGNRFNNHVENLREVTASQNAQNSKFRKNNTSGYKNVFFDKRNKKWRVLLRVNGVNKSFGYYDDLELADLVATEARDKFCGQYARHF